MTFETLTAPLATAAERLHGLRPEVSLDEFAQQLRNPIASRLIAVWVTVEIPILGKTLVFDTRSDNPEGLAPSLKELSADAAESVWPEKQRTVEGEGLGTLGHGGSSCPGYFKLMAVNEGTGALEIPVEILAFHAEGHNGEVAYSISMFSEVTGRVVAPPTDDRPAVLTMWGKMLVAVKPDNPDAFGGLERIELVSREYIRQEGVVSGFPPRLAGEFLESGGDEAYVPLDPALEGIEAIVRRGRIIFSTDVDEFLQARTRVTGFELLDLDGEPLRVGEDPHDPALIGRIGGVRIRWDDILGGDPHATHYRLYRIDPDHPENVEMIGDRLSANHYVDRDYDGRRSFAYAVVPAFIDSAGTEVQGVSLDYSTVMHLRPEPERFENPNHGVGHLRRMQ